MRKNSKRRTVQNRSNGKIPIRWKSGFGGHFAFKKENSNQQKNKRDPIEREEHLLERYRRRHRHEG
jgi:hypothetical protein